MKIKICPVCGYMNPHNSLDCEQCDYNLNEVNTTDNSAISEQPHSIETPIPESNAPEPGSSNDTNKKPKVFRICPKCGNHVPPNTYRCECGQMLHGIPLTASENAASTVSKLPSVCFMLRSEDGRSTIHIPGDETVTIGREATEADYLANKLYVGRRHLQVNVRDGIVYITDISSTNPTLVNGTALKKDTPYKLSENDLISLGARENQAPVENAAYFRLIREDGKA